MRLERIVWMSERLTDDTYGVIKEPQEAKEQEEEETPALPDYVDYFTAPVGGDWSSNQILDAQWAPEMASTLPPVASGWTGEAGVATDGWDSAAAP
ncbi:40S ribosomal protein SA-like isoform X2 [Olea europaea var. sylvestris]|uniref:40S ribosomal protein SA-like isoform X2 n=1 Tax=Olea europaea var. sylvestris TaxID=158386 RepID=UPI000C1D4A43|nr:40S ribosomal protein SA-like isoform X2 [Olea europaea var. sylvestris]XP_022887609.1 40S ribosomal protein SA-like isoform X2 [Olea europaea var. sylvestris]XP_022887610.1 40S ribosomal protein SA-like isoform X2 [Olea europaea var. sylvestris]